MFRFAIVGLAAFALAGTSAAAEKVRVACVGDSITAGSGYPKLLQQILGDGYEVKNYGVSGRTLLNKGDHPYTKEKAYKDALAFEPNVVVIKLGTNDTKPQNKKFADEFVADYTSLVESFQNLKSKPRVFVCTPVPVYGKGNFGITNEVLLADIKPKAEKVAADLKLPVIDLYTALSDKAEMFPDKVHPNAAGAKLMAEAVAKAIQADAKK